jgi:hypothetical protein
LWAHDLASMIQVSLVAYMSAGAFLGLAYFDFVYHLVATVVVVHHLVIAGRPQAEPVTAATPLSLFGAVRQAWLPINSRT